MISRVALVALIAGRNDSGRGSSHPTPKKSLRRIRPWKSWQVAIVVQRTVRPFHDEVALPPLPRPILTRLSYVQLNYFLRQQVSTILRLVGYRRKRRRFIDRSRKLPIEARARRGTM
jgi:hypothetical protein